MGKCGSNLHVKYFGDDVSFLLPTPRNYGKTILKSMENMD